MRRPFRIGEEVALSATFLRSMGTINLTPGGGSGPTTFDKGIGRIINFEPAPCDFLAWVLWKDHVSTVNVFNLVHRADIHLEAMRAEH